MLAINKDGWIESTEGTSVVHCPSVRTMRLKVAQPLGLVWHWTANLRAIPEGVTSADQLARSIQSYRRGRDRPASWHLLIDQDGSIFQSISLLKGAWHVGRPGVVAGRSFRNVNRATVGVEIVNSGGLKQVGEYFYAWPFYENPRAKRKHRRLDSELCIDQSRAKKASDQNFYEDFTNDQIKTAVLLVSALRAHFNWQPQQCMMSHADFAYPYKIDPGPLFLETYLPQIVNKAFNVQEKEDAEQTCPLGGVTYGESNS